MTFQTPNPFLYQLRDGSLSDPYVDKVEVLKPVDSRVILSELPVKQNGVLIDGFSEVETNTPIGTQFYVDYTYGVIYLYGGKANPATVTVRYKGRGVVLLPADRIYHQNDNSFESLEAYLQNTTATVEDYRLVLSSMQTQLNTLVLQGDSSVEAAQARVGIDGVYYQTLKERLDKEISNKNSGSPKGVYSTLSALQASKPNGDEYIYVVTADGKWYFWSGVAWTAGGTYQETAIADGSVTQKKLAEKAVSPEKTDFLIIGKNKLNLSNCETDKLLQSNGQTTTSIGYKTSEYILLSAGTYTLSKVRWYGFYDLTKTVITNPFINTGSNNAVVTVTIDQPRYLRCSFATSNQFLVQVESGTIATSPETYRIAAPILQLSQEQISQVPVPDMGALYPIKLVKSGEIFTFESQFDSTQNIVIQTSRSGSKNGAFNFLSTTVGGTLIHSNTDDITPIRTFTTVGANHGYTTVLIVTMNSHGKTNSDLGSKWTDGVTQYTLLNITGNDLTLACPYTVTSGVVSSSYIAPVGNLTHASGASNTQSINVSTLAVEPQLFPSINNIKVKYLLDGKSITSDGTYYGNELRIQESYNVMDYKSIIDYAQSNIGSSYKSANIDGIVRLSNTFVYTKGLKCTTAHNFEALKKVSLLNCGFLQAIPLSPVGHTRKRFMPGVNSKSGWDFESGIDLDSYNTSLIFTPSDLKDPTIAPSHYTDWTYLNNVRMFGFSMGYIVDKGNAKHAERIANTTTIWDMRNTKKSYPVALRGTLESGEYRSYFGFRNYISPEEVGQATNLNYVKDSRDAYLYVTLNAPAMNLSKEIESKVGNYYSLLQTDGISLKGDVVDSNGITVSSSSPKSNGIIKVT